MERLELARALGAAAAPTKPTHKPIVIEERDPVRFKLGFAEAVDSGADVFLADPDWSESARGQFAALRHPNFEKRESRVGGGWLMIASGGTSGRLKLARHDQTTIAAAVRGFTKHFGMTRVNAVGVLPLYHVSGLMAWMRCALTGGEHIAWDWKRLEAGERPVISRGSDWVMSLVPTQLQRLLGVPAAVGWLRQFRVIFLGGGPSWPGLNDAAAAAGLPISLSYGMTETAAMVTALRPDDFLSGDRSAGPAMPQARVTTDAEGRVRIEGESLFRGYWPEWHQEHDFVTDDLGRIDEQGHLHLLGRRDAVIITGGKKVQPMDVETALRASGEFTDVAVIGVPDPEWGEVVVACYPAGDRAPDVRSATAALAPHERPKRFVALAGWPRNPQGKLNRAALVAAVRSAGADPRG
jgi:o-succinylbenzoate---CoA ligase